MIICPAVPAAGGPIEPVDVLSPIIDWMVDNHGPHDLSNH
jgi:hypothetical protein